ncbi:hypothetical protein MPTK1_3g17300 [Marchantia polymorpha subsp. ruderalis]|uniref:Uncharacterized protein n=2 Tax=Marchantia polymorpha TaxID=3197 RepID=A0AAF6B1R9_MARPO|nr:hypothetical protein MARPO_0039s0064 [Marchantia polymorpha]BBN05953.1 hypothetical protein Mp_3g17300 [Marchantia polymorpha subsp. ruderalis]|eukprot:PTQ40571.1 hypothetical protein MARPO_0039s0064 [Marchantia polymorpha]
MVKLDGVATWLAWMSNNISGSPGTRTIETRSRGTGYSVHPSSSSERSSSGIIHIIAGDRIAFMTERINLKVRENPFSSSRQKDQASASTRQGHDYSRMRYTMLHQRRWR